MGLLDDGIPKQPVGVRADAFNLHKSIGMTIFALMAIRLAWRAAHPPPPLPPMAAWQVQLSRFTHALLYVALLLQPLVGYLGSEVSGYPVKYFGVVLAELGGQASRAQGLPEQRAPRHRVDDRRAGRAARRGRRQARAHRS